MYYSLKIPSRTDHLLTDFCVVGPAHCTISYGVLHGGRGPNYNKSEAWNSFWRVKTLLQALLFKRVVTFIVRQHSKNSWRLDEDCELQWLITEMRRVMLESATTVEVEPAPAPLHITWVPL